MILTENIKRLGIYFFFDKHGDVDDYIPYFLKDLNKSLDRTVIVVNGKLTDKGSHILHQYGDVLVRENKGFDVWAYKSALEYVGWETLKTYDEIVLLNSTIMGPIYSFKETFDKMNCMDLDFWGLTKFFKYDADPFGCIKYGYIPDHIQSHFIAIRKPMINSEEFYQYWSKMPMINSYSEAVGKHEAIFTKHFSDLGFKWDVSVQCDDLREFTGYPLLMCPKLLIKQYRCPIFKKRSFFHNIDDYLDNTTGEQTSELYDYLDNHTQYPVDYIWDTILKSYPQADIVKNMNLVYILQKNGKKDISHILATRKIALVMHVYFMDLLDDTFEKVSVMPKEAHIYLTTNTREKQILIQEKFKHSKFAHLDVRLIENRGRDVSSLLVGVKDVIMDYDYVCFAHDKKTAQVTPTIRGAGFAYKCFENTLGSQRFVCEVIETFESNSRLGLLTPPEPNHAIFFPTLGAEWGPNYDITKELAKELQLTVPISSDKPPVAPFGTMFWFRPKAMKPLFDKDWEYTDFPEEPNKIDGTLLHAVERIYPFIVQQSGYYPAIGMTDKFAAIEYGNLKHYLRGYNLGILGAGVGPYYPKMREEMCYRMASKGGIVVFTKALIKKVLRKVLPPKMKMHLREFYGKMHNR
ncbi:rhamnan synthesis F family protein [Carnobacteriaceae bacterium zg-84]|uniref:rhamnan synthesis F family protein n=1 Tax=Granulicatella sp. zg-84 TaxID=2678503 RepID=UPI0013C267A7|nr:rhamnan synthesis F family protein [Granulicatella sp. zg-84]NEW66168.1 rhamnan synthesis protein F [Granulicatella sp. zg-84]QMI86074.1 rhamnan synthesis F family protein [Carnobacteriaceae bacterium zg-84]